jgi:hypothetical protein
MAHVTFIHGIGNKTPAETLRTSWLTSLADNEGPELEADGVTSSMAYWADFMYEAPLPVSGGNESLEAVEKDGVEDVDMGWRAEADPEEQALVARLEAKLEAARIEAGLIETAAPPPSELGGREELLPPFMAQRFMKAFLRDVHHYLFNELHSPRPGVEHRIRDVIRDRVVETLQEGADRPGPHIVVSHSMGTVIMYDCLKRVEASPRVDALLTIGSPLGLDEIQDPLKPEWSRSNGFPSERVADRWLNVYDRIDVVALLDPKLANDYRRDDLSVVQDLNEDNYGRWRHDIGKYLGGTRLRTELAGMLGLDWP